jgi:hypothetical protein
MNDGPWKLHTGYLGEGLELFIRKVVYTKYDATVLVRCSTTVKIRPVVCVHFVDFYAQLSFGSSTTLFKPPY